MANFSSNLSSRYVSSKGKPSEQNKCLIECPSCGGLECLCRPRFFAGQLLTEEDLTRLEDYVVKKNRLHNRYLQGWGVVCGLEVVCAPCESGAVTVQSGYALSPCGNDIIVCDKTTADICDLIRRCRRKETPECEPPARPSTGLSSSATTGSACGNIEEEWILSICYQESPSRGITALKGSSESACCSSCSCGGSGNCDCKSRKSSCKCGGNCKGGCGCSGSQTTTSAKNKRRPAQCEPTLICEGFSFKVCRRPKPMRDEPDRGAFVERALCCYRDLQAAIIPPPNTQDPNQIRDWCCRQKDALVDLLASYPVTECRIYDLLADLCPSPQAAVKFQEIVAKVAAIFEYLVRHCLCSTLLPPCPCPEDDDCVPLAVVTVKTQDCSVIKICNLSERKFATTMPALQYWLSIFPFGRNLRRTLEQACCAPIRKATDGLATGATLGRSGRLGRTAYRAARPGTFASFYSAVTREQKLSPEMIVLAEMGVLNDKNSPFATEAEMDSAVESLFMNQVFAPILDRELPLDWGAIGMTFPERVDDTEELRDTVFEMKRVIDEQKKTIDDLVARLSKK